MEDQNNNQGCHPMKRLRRQTIDQMEEEMAQGRPAAHVVNMRRQKPESEPKPQKEQEVPYEPLFSDIRERSPTKTDGRAQMKPEIDQSEADVEADKVPVKKKKQSLFAQRKALLAQSQSQGQQSPNDLVNQSKDDYFPKATVVYQAPAKEERKQRDDGEMLGRKTTTPSELGSLKQIGVGDEAIDQENMQKITQMSPEEIQAAQKQILEQLGMTHANALQKFKSNFGKQSKPAKKQSISLEYEDDQDKQKQTAEETSHNTLQTGQVSEAIHKAAAELEAQNRFSRQIGINFAGNIKLFEQGEVCDQPEDQQRYLSYIASEADNFEELDAKFFTLDEVQNLLASSHHQHRLYALDMLINLLHSSEKPETILGTILHPDNSQIITRLTQVIKVSSTHIDCTRRLCDLINALMTLIFGDIPTQMEDSLTNDAAVKGVRLFQIYLSDMIQGGKVFASSSLVSQSQSALAILDHLFESDPNVLLLLTRSLQKCIVYAQGAQDDGPEQAAFCLAQVLQTLHWFCLYDSKVSEVAIQLFKEHFQKVTLALVPHSADVWKQANKIIKEFILKVALSETESSKVLKDFVEPMTSEFQKRALKNLTEVSDQEDNNCTQNYLQNIFLLSHLIKDNRLLTFVNGQLFNVMLELAQKSSSPRVLLLLSKITQTLGTDNLKPIKTLANERLLQISHTTGAQPQQLITWSTGEALRMAKRCEEPRAKQATLAALAPIKAQLLLKLKSSTGADDLCATVTKLLRLVNVDDEHILHELITGYLFDPATRMAGVSLDGSKALTLLTFFLGYCRSDEQVSKANALQFEKKSLKVKDFFVPLLDDWFIRPLFFLESLDDSSLQTLAQAIYSYLGQYYNSNPTNDNDLVRITQSELIFLTIFLIKTQAESLSEQTQTIIDETVDKVFFNYDHESKTLSLSQMSMSDNAYLLEAFKQTFLADNMVQSLVNFFNERPAETSPTMYKLLVLVISSPDVSLENFKQLMSETAEVIPCVLRQEQLLLRSPIFYGQIDHIKVVKSKCSDRQAYIRSYLSKLQVKEESLFPAADSAANSSPSLFVRVLMSQLP